MGVVKPRPSAQPRGGSGSSLALPTPASIAAALKAALGASDATSKANVAWVDIAAPGNHAVRVARRQVAHNLAVLSAQDVALSAAEDRYADTLLDAQTAMLARWSARPPEQIAPARLRAYDHFLDRQIGFCISQRGRLNEANAGRLQAAKGTLTRLAQRAFDANRSAHLQLLSKAGSTLELDFLLREHFETPIVKSVAFDDPGFSSKVRQTRIGLEQTEAQACQIERDRVEAESRQAALALRQQYLDNARRNLAPTEAQLAELAAGVSMRKTDANSRYLVVRTGPVSYDTRHRLFGNVYPWWPPKLPHPWPPQIPPP